MCRCVRSRRDWSFGSSLAVDLCTSLYCKCKCAGAACVLLMVLALWNNGVGVVNFSMSRRY